MAFLGRSDVEIGPHVFPDTKLIEIQYDNVQTSYTGAPSQLPMLRTDIVLEFKENNNERFILPLECALIEKVIDPPMVLISTIIPATPKESAGTPAPQQPITFRFVQAGTAIWEALQRRVLSSSLNINQIQQILRQTVSDHATQSAWIKLTYSTDEIRRPASLFTATSSRRSSI